MVRNHWKSTFVEEGRVVGHWKANENEKGEGVLTCMSVCFFKKMLRFSKWSFITILQFFLLIIMAVWNIKQTIMKDYNIQSCQWIACNHFRRPFLLCTTFHSLLCFLHCFLWVFSAKLATYSLVIGNVYFVISS